MGSAGSARRVSTAGAEPQLDALRHPGLGQYRRPIEVHSSLTSQHSRWPSAGRPRAMHSAE